MNILPDTYFVLDFDRTLGNTDKLTDIFEAVLTKHTSLDLHVLRQAKLTAEAKRKSFKVATFIQQYLNETEGEISWHELRQKFIEAAKDSDTLQPYARELLALLNEKKLPYGIITFGDEMWQLTKLEAAGLLEIPHIVTRIQEKGELLRGWKKDSGEFIIPPALTSDFKPIDVSQIVFIDDKPVSFINLPSNVTAIRVRPPEGLVLPIQNEPVPPNVYEVEGIDGVIKLLFNTN